MFNTERLLYANVFFSLLVAFALWAVIGTVISLIRRKPEEKLHRGIAGLRRARVEPVTALPPLLQRALAPLMYDLGHKLFGGDEASAQRVEDRLRRSGWLYTSVGDYYASKMASAVLYSLGGAWATIIAGFPPFVIAVAALGLGLLGMYIPDNKISDMTNKRKQSLYREMAFTIDRLAVVLRTGLTMGSAMGDLANIGARRPAVSAQEAKSGAVADLGWVGSARGGLFTAMLRDLSNAIASNQDIEAAIRQVRASVPLGITEVDEFLELVKTSVKEGMGEMAPQLEALGRTMREDLNMKIEERAQKTEMTVVAITAATIVPAMLIIILGPTLVHIVAALSPGG